MSSAPARQSFTVDIAGLLRALTEQFPEPLLCVRELVQNAADAGAERIEVDVAFDRARELFRMSVRDDGRGMNAREVDAYLTIGFSEKDPARDRGRFGVGKLSPYALGITRMVVESSDGRATHRLTFHGDGTGNIDVLVPRPRGTNVHVYKKCGRAEAERLAERTFELVRDRCGSLSIPLFVNGRPVNKDAALPTPHSISFSTERAHGVLGIAADPVHILMGGGIVLETDAPLLGPEVSFIIDSPRLSPTLSRNAVRRDQAFDGVLRDARAEIPALVVRIAAELRARVSRHATDGRSIERDLDANDRAALEWLRSLLLQSDDELPHPAVRDAPVLETADGGLVSANALVEILRKEGRVPISRVPRTREELTAYADRGVVVLLLYRDVEDFLERQAIPTVEIDTVDDGFEIEERRWGHGELALADRARAHGRSFVGARSLVAASCVCAGLVAVWAATRSTPMVSSLESSSSTSIASTPQATVRSDGAATPSSHGTSITSNADLLAASTESRPPSDALRLLAGIVALLSVAAGCSLLYFTFTSRKPRPSSWIRSEAGAPLTVGESRRRRLHVLGRALFNPIDFLVARGWSIRAAERPAAGAPVVIEHHREFLPETPIRVGVRLDLDRIEIGFIDLVSPTGDAHDGRILVRRGRRVLLNRNHPTVRDLIDIACADKRRARLLLDILLATDPDLAKGTDPRQVEWDLLGRAELDLSRTTK